MERGDSVTADCRTEPAHQDSLPSDFLETQTEAEHQAEVVGLRDVAVFVRLRRRHAVPDQREIQIEVFGQLEFERRHEVMGRLPHFAAGELAPVLN